MMVCGEGVKIRWRKGAKNVMSRAEEGRNGSLYCRSSNGRIRIKYVTEP